MAAIDAPFTPFNSNSESGYRDDIIQVSGSFISSNEGSRMPYSVWSLGAPAGQASSTDIITWPSKMVQKYLNGSLGLCTLTFVTYERGHLNQLAFLDKLVLF